MEKREMKRAEDILQKQCVEWFRWQYPKGIIYAIPNGGGRSKAEAGILKATGVLKGIPDLCVPEPTSSHPGLYVEMKVKPNVVKPHQKEIIEKLKARGYLAVVCWTYEEFVAVVKDYFKERKVAA